MELFYTANIEDNRCYLDNQELTHLLKVLRHKRGDEVKIIDGKGHLYLCTIEDDNIKSCYLSIKEDISSKTILSPICYNLVMGVCPTKNIDRFEWFTEKATEIGLSAIMPLVGYHSERKVIKLDRLERICISAIKQSLKLELPKLYQLSKVSDFIRENANNDGIKLIAYCADDVEERMSITSVLDDYKSKLCSDLKPNITILIGPEGDFSQSEVELALKCGFIPITLGSSRLRTETAALVAVTSVYLSFI